MAEFSSSASCFSRMAWALSSEYDDSAAMPGAVLGLERAMAGPIRGPTRTPGPPNQADRPRGTDVWASTAGVLYTRLFLRGGGLRSCLAMSATGRGKVARAQRSKYGPHGGCEEKKLER